VANEQIETLRDRALKKLDGRRVPVDLTRRLRELSEAQFALDADVVDLGAHSDTLSLGITLHRRTLVPPCPEGWVHFAPKDVADTGSYEGSKAGRRSACARHELGRRSTSIHSCTRRGECWRA
jgi:hypothetical protein